MDPIIQVVVETAGKVMTKEVKMLYRVKEEVEEMKRELQWMQSFLDDADHHNVTSQSQSRVFRQQVLEVREARLDAEDIVDTYSVKLALRKRSGVMNHIKRYACIPRRGRDIHLVGLEIEAVKSKLETLRLRLQTYGLRELRLGDGPSSSTPDGGNKSWQSRSYGHIPDRNVVGLDRHISEVIDMLLGREENEPCRVVSIYGMGGLGKTTLAKKVYGHERMKRHFDKFAWVYVSQQFNARDVWESTLADLTSQGRKGISELSDSQLFAQLSQVQKEHKCLVVLDDVWSIQAWEQLIVGFRIEETSQSKILFTSRKEEVAVNASRKGSYGKLKPLSNEESLELLRKTALEGRDHEIADEKKDNLAKGMIEHCGGLPLAIIVLGGVLATKDSLREWQTVHDNVNAYLRRGRGHNEEQGLGVHPVLAYSYYDLPLQLKTCFIYLSQFPEDYEIPTNKLMKMWMAEGFVSVEYDGEGEETMEDVADRYLNELVEVGKIGSTGRIKTCRLHDMMREVCLSRAKEENFIHNVQREGTWNATSKGKIRRLSLFGDATRSRNEVSLSGYERNSQVRSLSLLCDVGNYYLPTLAPVHLADSFKLLRMLLLERIDIRHLKDASKEIGKLIHLKYLSLLNSRIYDFPSMDKLGCMERLDLRINTVKKKMCLIKIGEIWKMNQLRHLYLPYEWVEYSTDGDDLQIEGNPNLQTLVNFPPNCKEGRLLKFPNLRKLYVVQRKHGLQFWEILINNTGFSLSRLHSLRLEVSSNGDLELLFKRCPHLYKLNLEGRIVKFPQLNQFPNELTKLTLRYSLIQDPEHIETTLGKLPNLRILRLVEAFNGEQLSFKKGTFLQLKNLLLGFMTELNSWTVEHGAMPNLEHLEIFYVEKLATVPEGLRSIATLNKLEISSMPPQFAERLKEGGADFDKVKHVPSITFTTRILR